MGEFRLRDADKGGYKRFIRHPYGWVTELTDREDSPVINMAVVEITDDILHHHSRATEMYYILAGKGRITLDGTEYPIEPGTCILIKPNTRHRARADEGETLKILVASSPAYDPNDEFKSESEK